MMIFQGLVGVAILVLDLWAMLNVVRSEARGLSKVLWLVVILLLPLFGALAWLVAGPRPRRG